MKHITSKKVKKSLSIPTPWYILGIYATRRIDLALFQRSRNNVASHFLFKEISSREEMTKNWNKNSKIESESIKYLHIGKFPVKSQVNLKKIKNRYE